MKTDFCDRPEPLPGAALAGAYSAPDALADRRAIAGEPGGYWRAQARRLIRPLDPVARRCAAQAVRAGGTGR